MLPDSLLEERARALGPWFHNLRLGATQTARDHFLGDFPANFWQYFSHALPADCASLSVLDIGCNGGFYSFELHRRGARRILAVDHELLYITQARFAREQLGVPEQEVDIRRLDVYELDRLAPEQFDLVLFLGVFYHLRHPLYALEKVVERVRPGGTLVFQSMERGSDDLLEPEPDYPFSDRDVFYDERYPRLHFVEHKYAGDETNWWIPNASASRAMLRSTGLRIVEHPCQEVYICERGRPEERGA